MSKRTSPPAPELGSTAIRSELNALYGGGAINGIATTPKTDVIMLFSDPIKGEKSGYIDGAINNPHEELIFEYSGDGQTGDQTFVRGNKYVLHHREYGLRLFLFRAVGYHNGTATRTHCFIGEFELDPEEELRFRYARSKDKDGIPRTSIAFLLHPVGDYYNGIDLTKPDSEGLDTADIPLPLTIPGPDKAEVKNSPVEQANAHKVHRRSPGATVAYRNETLLVHRFGRQLEQKDHEVGSKIIKIPGANGTLRADIFDATEDTLYEAKSGTSRKHVREAVIQLLDYQRTVHAERLCILLPSRPIDDLIDLAHQVGVDVVYEDDNSFERINSGQSPNIT
ncbi:hypothetical protein [Salininema proteolyticum]|uniref:ScoMcrA-like SRA domain-containing protein n=1 Tax=Salininema proteolyticum TaxID=1607685 RepID=A0ABV8U2J1_9ACTN